MAKYQCSVCGYVYNEEEGDPDSNIPPGTILSRKNVFGVLNGQIPVQCLWIRLQ